MTQFAFPPLDEETLDIVSKLSKLPQRQNILVWGGDPDFVSTIAHKVPVAQFKVVSLDEKDLSSFTANSITFADRISVLETTLTTTTLSDNSMDLIILCYLLYRHPNPLTLLNEVIRLLSPIGLLLIIDYRALPLREYVGLVRKKYASAFPDDAFEEYAITNKYSTEDIGILLDLKSFMVLKCISWRERQVLVVAQHW